MKGQTILIRTRSKHGKDVNDKDVSDEGDSGDGNDNDDSDDYEGGDDGGGSDNVKAVNAREIADQLSSCVSALDNDVKFDSKVGVWYDTAVLVIARPGSGKTWMMQQAAHYMCECYLGANDGAYKFVPVLFSIQRVARLHRASSVDISSTGDSNEITNQTDALHFLEVMLKWDYDEATVQALLDCYNARTLVILLDGLDEASSLARMFETLGIFLAKSGNRVVMAGRPEGVASEVFYSESPGWTLLDLLKLSVEQQKAIANHQIQNIEGPFFDRFYAYQDCRNAFDTAAEKCGIDMDMMHVVLSKINCKKMEVTPETMFSCTVLEEVESMFNDDEDFVRGKKNGITKPEFSAILDFMNELYERATLASAQLLLVLDEVAGGSSGGSSVLDEVAEAGDRMATQAEQHRDKVVQLKQERLEKVQQERLEEARLERRSLVALDSTKAGHQPPASETGKENKNGIERVKLAKNEESKNLVVKMPLKKPKRALQSARRNGGFHNVTNIVQGSIVCDDYKQMLRVLNCIASSTSVNVSDIHNGFKEPDFVHYRCLIVTMSINILSDDSSKKKTSKRPYKKKTSKHPSFVSHSVELHLHLKAMYDLLPSCQVPCNFFLEQVGLCGNDKQRMSDLKKSMDVVHAVGKTPVLLSVFLMYIKACTSKLSGEERDQTSNVQTCPPMPSSLHFMYQEAMWGTLEAQENDPSSLLKVLQTIAFDNMKNGMLHACVQ